MTKKRSGQERERKRAENKQCLLCITSSRDRNEGRRRLVRCRLFNSVRHFLYSISFIFFFLLFCFFVVVDHVRNMDIVDAHCIFPDGRVPYAKSNFVVLAQTVFDITCNIYVYSCLFGSIAFRSTDCSATRIICHNHLSYEREESNYCLRQSI